MPGILLLALSALVLLTSFMSGVFGMAGGMVLMGGLLMMVPVQDAMLLHGATQVTSTGWRTLMWRSYVSWRVTLRFTIGLAVGLAVLAALRFVPDPRLVILAMGVSPFLAVAIPERYVVQVEHRGGAELCGLISMVFQVFAGVGGPMMDLFFVRSRLDRRCVLSTKSSCQAISQIFKLVYFGGLAASAPTTLGIWPFLVAIIVGLVGTSISRIVVERLTDVQFRAWTRWIVMAVGSVYLVQGTLAYLR